jgi:hypothetical protein
VYLQFQVPAGGLGGVSLGERGLLYTEKEQGLEKGQRLPTYILLARTQSHEHTYLWE